MDNAICKLLGIKYPIFQGGMAWIAESNLAAAVSNAGGLGIIAAGNAPYDVVKKEIVNIKTLTDKPFGVNIMLMSPFADDIARLCCEENVPVVTTGAGAPTKYTEAFKAKGIKIIPVVPSVAIAKMMERSGADAVIAEGMESGGHVGKLTSMAIVPQVVDALKIPVIGAGGVGDGRGMAAMFMLGASGVQIGTRFLSAYECKVHANYKKKILGAKDIDTVVTGQLAGHPIRALRNKLTRMIEDAEKEEAVKDKPDVMRIEEIGAGGLRKAAVDGDIEFGSIMAGQISGLVNKEQSCEEIINDIMREFLALTKQV